jgi:hypothetical protein
MLDEVKCDIGIWQEAFQNMKRLLFLLVCNLSRKERERAKLTKEVDAVSSVVQPFRNHKVEFDPLRITEKPPLSRVGGNGVKRKR